MKEYETISTNQIMTQKPASKEDVQQSLIKSKWIGFPQVFWCGGVSGLLRHLAELFCTQQYNGVSLSSPPIHALGCCIIAAVKIQHPKYDMLSGAQERKGEGAFRALCTCHLIKNFLLRQYTLLSDQNMKLPVTHQSQAEFIKECSKHFSYKHWLHL